MMITQLLKLSGSLTKDKTTTTLGRDQIQMELLVATDIQSPQLVKVGCLRSKHLWS